MAAVQMIDNMMATLEHNITTKTVIGEPVKVGNVTLVPVVDLLFGFGGGLGEGKAKEETPGQGSGGGAGARLAPKAVIVIKDNGEVSVLPFTRGGPLEKLVEILPTVIEKVQMVLKKEEAKKEEPKKVEPKKEIV